MTFGIKFPPKVFLGEGSIKNLAEIQKTHGSKRPCVLTDKGVLACGVADRVLAELENAGVISDLSAEPTIGDANALCDRLSAIDCDMIVAVGGGSVLDTGKLLAAAYTNPAYKADLRSPEHITQPPLPTVAIPTSSGTGSEATANAILLFPEEELKIGIISDAFLYRTVLLDPSLTVGLPPALTASTGLDALCHAVESYLSTLNNPLNETFAFEAMRLIAANLERAYQNGGDLPARQGMQLAAFYAGACLTTSSTVAVHALSYPLGGRFHIPHGVANAILLPEVMRANLECARDKFAKIAQLMLPGVERIPEEERPEALLEYLFALTSRLRIPTKLGGFGVRAEDLGYLAENACKVERLLGKNPRKLTRDDIRAIYQTLL